MNKPRRKSASTSRRVAWPEPGNDSGGEFRLTWGRIAAIVTILASIVGSVPLYWSISDHWMNRIEIEKAMKIHADHDLATQQWNQFGFAANRLEYLDDKAAECDAKRMTQAKLRPEDASMCGRYEAKQKLKQVETNDLKAKALEASKEK